MPWQLLIQFVSQLWSGSLSLFMFFNRLPAFITIYSFGFNRNKFTILDWRVARMENSFLRIYFLNTNFNFKLKFWKKNCSIRVLLNSLQKVNHTFCAPAHLLGCQSHSSFFNFNYWLKLSLFRLENYFLSIRNYFASIQDREFTFIFVISITG